MTLKRKSKDRVRFSNAIALSILLWHLTANSTETLSTAPFIDETEIRAFSEQLLAEIGVSGLAGAKNTAIENSHLDDKITQRNLAAEFAKLAELVTEWDELNIEYVQTSKFGRSFIRHQYAVTNRDVALRCMLTFRRKTDGWRLNQLWCT
ncbi:MAG: hypothetical protein AAF387_20905 [Pseudomonadota bacterium]